MTRLRALLPAALLSAGACATGPQPRKAPAGPPVAVVEAAIRHFLPAAGKDKCDRYVVHSYVSVLGVDPDPKVMERFQCDLPPVSPGSSADVLDGEACRVLITGIEKAAADKYVVDGAFESPRTSWRSRIDVIQEAYDWTVRPETDESRSAPCAAPSPGR